MLLSVATAYMNVVRDTQLVALRSENVEFFQAQREKIYMYYIDHRWQTAAIFLFAYVAMAALSIPGATILTLIGGAVFGLVVGTVLVSFASAIGATLVALYLGGYFAQEARDRSP